jgi:DNA replication protein DnaC
MNHDTTEIPECIRKAQVAWEARQAQLAEQRRLDAAVKAADANSALQRLLGVIGTLPDSKECERHKGQTAVFIEEATSRSGRPVYRCPLCVNDSAAIRREHAIVSAGVPADVRHATLDNFNVDRPNVKMSAGMNTPAKFLEIAREFHARTCRNGLICGKVGIGKSHLAAAIAIDRIEHGWPVAWIECSRLFREWHESYSKNGPDAIIARLTGANLLVLDEIALTPLPKDGEEILFEILNGRHKSGVQSLLLSNEPVPAVRDWLGERISDRLRSGTILAAYGEWDSMRGNEGSPYTGF